MERPIGELLVLPPLRAREGRGGTLLITRKFLDGMERYARDWPGPVRAVLHPGADVGSDDLDAIDVDPRRLPFGLGIEDFRSRDLWRDVGRAAVVLGTPDHLLGDAAERCAALGVPYVVVTELTLADRCRIIAAGTTNPVIRARRMVWAWNRERANRRIVRAAAGVQCNGTPTYDEYLSLNADALLFFDNRLRASSVPPRPAVHDRLAALRAGAPLRLAYSGRLHPIKGAGHLVHVAAELERVGVAFTLDVCGDGPLRGSMEAEIARLGLGTRVRMRGALDFRRELVPLIRDEIDLFVCCHVQGDPSCTYIETLGCGVPIAGYANAALSGILARAPAGWTVATADARALAARIAEAAREPARLAAAAAAGLAFARDHTVERTFAARTAHLLRIARRGIPRAGGAVPASA